MLVRLLGRRPVLTSRWSKLDLLSFTIRDSLKRREPFSLERKSIDLLLVGVSLIKPAPNSAKFWPMIDDFWPRVCNEGALTVVETSDILAEVYVAGPFALFIFKLAI